MLPIILRWTFFIYEWTFLNKTCSCAKFTLSHVQYTQKQNMAYQITWNLLPRLWILRFQKPFAFPTYQWNKTVILTKDYIRCMFVCFFSHMWIQISTVTAFDTISDWWGGMQMSYQTRVHVAASLLEAWHFQSCSLIYLWSTLFWSNATCCAVISMSILRCDEIGFLWETKSTIVRQLQSGLNFCVRSNQAQCDWYLHT